MWYLFALLAILGTGTAVLYWKTRSDMLGQATAVTKEATSKVEALEKTAQESRQEEHDDDVEEAVYVLESGDRERVIGFLIGSVRRKADPDFN